MPRLHRPDLDKIIGQNLRVARALMSPRTSQGKIGEALSCTFQQVQKYESGKDSITASTLVRLSEITGQPIDFFFAGVIVGAPPFVDERADVSAEPAQAAA